MENNNIKVKGNIRFNPKVVTKTFENLDSLYEDGYVKFGNEVVSLQNLKEKKMAYEQNINVLGQKIKQNKFLHSENIHVLYVGDKQIMVVLKSDESPFKIPKSFARTLLIVDPGTLKTLNESK